MKKWVFPKNHDTCEEVAVVESLQFVESGSIEGLQIG